MEIDSTLRRGMPVPEAIAEASPAALRHVGLSGAKARARGYLYLLSLGQQLISKGILP